MKPVPVSIILPTLNEFDNLPPFVEKLIKIINPREIIIVDDNSSDGTGILAKKLEHEFSRIKVIVNNPPIGLAPSIQKGINKSTSPYVAWMDVDFSHPPGILKKMLKEILQADIVTGSWLAQGGQDLRREVVTKLISYIINKFCQLVFNNKLTAYTSGFILTKKDILEEFHLKGNYGEYCIDFLVRMSAKSYVIQEVPFVCRSRKKGKSKTAPNLLVYFRQGMKYINMIISLHNYMFKAVSVKENGG